MSAVLQEIAAEMRRVEPDRFLALLFLPEPQRSAALAVLAFHHEIARMPHTVSQPMLGSIRLQWWADALAGLAETGAVAANAPPLLAALAEAHKAVPLPFAALEALLEAQEAELEREDAPADLPAFAALAEAQEAPLLLALWFVATGRAATPAEAAALAQLARGYGLSSRLLATPALLARGEVLLPRDLLAAAGTSPDGLLAGKADPSRLPDAVRPVIVAAAEAAEAGARALRGLRPPAALLLWRSLTVEHLQRLRRYDGQVLDARLATPSPWRPLILWWNARRGR